MKVEINDIRKKCDFKKITFSKYKKAAAKKRMIKCVVDGIIEEACYWGGEFICAGHFLDLWEILFELISKNIYITNPKLPIYLWMRFEIFKDILSRGYKDHEIRMRNNLKIRKLFAEIITVLSLSRKNNPLNIVKIDKNDFHMKKMATNLNAPNTLYANHFFKKEDPKEFIIAINELSYHLSNDSRNSRKACYWVEWIIQFDTISKKKTARRTFINVQSKFQMDVVWIIWEAILFYSRKDLMRKKIVKHLLQLFCIYYSPSSKRKRRFLIYFAILLITEPVNFSVSIFNKNNIIQNVKDRIDIVYKQIKKNEISPNTDYLFNNSFTGGKNIENTIKKLEKMDSFMNIYYRTNN